MTLTDTTPAQFANNCIKQYGICKVRWIGSVPQNGILIKHPRTPNEEFRFLFIGYKTDVRIAVAFGDKLHPRLEFRDNGLRHSF